VSTERPQILPEFVDGTLLGQQIGEFYVTALLGQGPLADVYIATDIETQDRVIIKVMPKTLFRSRIAYDRLEKRIGLVSKRLRNPGIAVPAGYSIHPDGHFVVITRLHEGRIIGRIFEKDGPLSERTAVAVIHLAARILTYAHKQGLIHGNLKPGNLLLTPEGKLIILDWASPRTSMLYAQHRVPDGVLRDPYLDTGIAYLAPELIKGSDDVNPACDVFSLGSVLCYMLAGRRPYEGNAKLVLQKVSYSDVPDVIDKIPGIKVSTAKLILHMMHNDPARRLSDAEALLDEVDSHLRGLS